MDKKHAILELPLQDDDFKKILGDKKHQILNILFSSAAVEGQVKHFVLIIWHDFEYGDHTF